MKFLGSRGTDDGTLICFMVALGSWDSTFGYSPLMRRRNFSFGNDARKVCLSLDSGVDLC